MNKIQSPFVAGALLFMLAIFISLPSYGQKQISKGEVQRIKVHGKGLEGNLEGDSADRFVCVYLPASYKTNPKRRYPVIYFLHGYTDDDAKFYGFSKHWMNLVPVLDSVFASGAAKEMIVVTPNAYTRFQGSMYSNSITTGNWEDFVAKELVSYIDSHYRTIAQVAGRGLSGHSMGGYGALRIGQKNPEVFSSIYLLSPCCLNSPAIPDQIPRNFLRADSIKTFAEFEKADFGTKTIFANAAAWSPNPSAPPFYVDLPLKDGVMQPTVLSKWSANRPITTLDQYINNLKEVKAIAFDAGTRDQAIAASIRTLDDELNKYGIKHFFEIYEGDHINRVAERIAKKMLSFFSDNLSFDQRR
ncbi:MAG TPA: alpha/beta hydrolase-fold protein [Chitinophagaceae bacterium]|nr:alpha/beta hydrolase-fold protein [Chitinophagaceae bacterium]